MGGDVPEGWGILAVEELRLQEQYSLVGGPFGSDLTSKDYIEPPGVPVIRGANLSTGPERFIESDYVFVSEEKANALQRNMAFPGDLIFTQRGTLGQIGLIPQDAAYPRYVVSQSQMKLTPNADIVDAEYLYQFFSSPQALKRIDRLTIATGVPHINLGLLRRLEVPLPPLPEQRRIAEILSSVDDAIRATQGVIDQTRTVKQGLLQELLTRGIGHTRFKQTEIGEVPEGWEVVELGDHLRAWQYGTSAKCDRDPSKLPVLRIPNVVSERIDLTELKYADLTQPEVKRYSIAPDDLLVVRTNGNPDYVGRASLVPVHAGTWLFASYLIRLRVSGTRLLPSYLHRVFQAPQIRRLLRKEAQTSAGNYNINATQLRGLCIPLPPPDEQRMIVERIWAADVAMDSQQERGRALSALKSGLLQDLLTGRVRVNVDA